MPGIGSARRSPKALDLLDDPAMDLLEQVGLTAYAELNAGILPYGRKRALMHREYTQYHRIVSVIGHSTVFSILNN